MKFVQCLFILSLKMGLVTLQLDVLITKPLKDLEHVRDKIREAVVKNRAVQAENYLEHVSLDPNTPPGNNRRIIQSDDQQDYERLRLTEKNLGDEINLRKANADPTLHKHKLKHKVHSHSHIHSHTHGHSSVYDQSSLNPVINPVVTPIFPANQPTWHHSQDIHNNFNNQQFALSNQGFGMTNSGFHSSALAHGNIQQNTHLISNQNTHLSSNQNSNHLINQNNHLITGQNVHINSHGINSASGFNNGFGNNPLNFHKGNLNGLENAFGNHGLPGTGFNGGSFRNDALNVQIANINGHNNALSQSQVNNGQTHIFSQRETRPVLAEADIRRMDVPESRNREEVPLGDNPPRNVDVDSEPHQVEKIDENLQPAVYDTEMNNILNVLDMRSYLQNRPDVKPSPYYEKGYIVEAESSTGTPEKLQNCGCPYEQPKPDPSIEVSKHEYTGYNSDEKTHSDIIESDNINLQSPNLIQIPYNNYYQSYGWHDLNGRDKRSVDVKTYDDSMNNKAIFNDTEWQKQDLNETLDNYIKMIDSYRSRIKQEEEKVFADFLQGIVDDYRKREFLNTNDIKKIKKRSASIVKLLHNPNVKLDVPKTLDNIGTITKNAFEDERAPMYHFRNLMGSTKNAVLSAMRIPPQNFMIPSNYQIKNINPEEFSDGSGETVGAINPKILSRGNFGNDMESEDYNEVHSDPYGIVETFTKVGSAIRDSVRSGQNTLSHINDMAHDARKIYHTTKNSVPRVILPYAKAPVVMRSRFKDARMPPLKKSVIITPKIVDIKEHILGSKKFEPDYVKMGNILDALGISKPDNDQHLDLEKVVLKTQGKAGVRGIYIPPIGDVKSVNGQQIPSLKMAKEQTDRMNEKVSSSSKAVKEAWGKIKNDAANILEKSKNQLKNDIANTLERNKIRSEEITNNLQKNNGRNELMNSFKVDSHNLRSPMENSASANEMRNKHFTKEEENKIIDKFLNNIFKIDKKQESESKSVLHLGKDIQNKSDYAKNMRIISRNNVENNKETSNSNEKKPSLLLSASGNDTELRQLVKELAIEVLEDEAKCSTNKTRTAPVTLRKNKVKKTSLHRRTKGHPNEKTDVVLKSRFGDDAEEEQAIPINVSRRNDVLKAEESNGSDEEAIKRVDEYVANDLLHPTDAPNNENVRQGWRIGNVLQLVDDSPIDESSGSINKYDGDEETPPKFSSRTLLWSPENESREDERVGLDLPPELMKPFMARASTSEVDHIFGNAEEKGANVNDNRMDDELVGLNLPPELMKPFMARASNSEVEHIFNNTESNEEIVGSAPVFENNPVTNDRRIQYEEDFNRFASLSPSELIKSFKSQIPNSKVNNINDNGENDRLYQRENSNMLQTNPSESYRNPEIVESAQVLRREETRYTDNESEYILCSSSPNDGGSPILCRNVNSKFIPRPEHEFIDFQEITKPEMENVVGQSRTSMVVNENLRKPFMGLGNEDTIRQFYEEYNGEQDNLFGSQEQKIFSD